MSCATVNSLLYLSVCRTSADMEVLRSVREASSQNWHFSLYRMLPESAPRLGLEAHSYQQSL